MSITTAGRTLSASMVTEVTATQLAPILLANLQFSTPVYLWSGYGSLGYGGVTYLGIGTLGDISPIEETTDLAARGISMRLSGVPTANVALALTENYQGRACTILFGALSATAGTLISSPVTVFQGKMDVMQISDDGQSADLTMTAESRLMDFKRPREIRYTDEEQQNLFSGDVGLEFVNDIQEKPIYWGNPNQTQATNWDGGDKTGTEGTGYE
jgi:hypothetical protein